jgi:CheY-like chemotaxis protein
MAADGPSCLTLSRELRPDLYLLDISMPGMNGWELAKTLRSAGFTESRIIILSANIGETRPPAIEDQAHDDAIAKPFDLRQLVERLGAQLGLEWLEEGDAGPQGDSASDPPAQTAQTDADLAATPPLSAKDIAELLQFARIGYRRGLEKRMAELAVAADGGPILASLSHHLAQFDMTGLIAMLEDMDLALDPTDMSDARDAQRPAEAPAGRIAEGFDVPA